MKTASCETGKIRYPDNEFQKDFSENRYDDANKIRKGFIKIILEQAELL